MKNLIKATLIGLFFGTFGTAIGRISNEVISLCLSIAAGAMLYIVSGELIPESNKLYRGRIVAIRKYIRDSIRYDNYINL